MNKEALCYTDGASRGNPGRSSIGVVIIHQATGKQYTFSKYLGDKLTNNYAEYSAVVFCLEKLIEANIKSFELRADSELMIKQLNKEYKVSSKNILSLYNKIQEMLKNFEKYSFIHIRRKFNSLADSLANEALDGQY